MFQDREVKLKREKNPSVSSDCEEYEDEPPVIVVKKNNCEAVDDLADPLALSDTENNFQQKGELDSCAGAAQVTGIFYITVRSKLINFCF